MSNTKRSIEIWQGCTHCKNKSIEPNEQPCIECFAFDKYKPKTNADQIRNMSDEELAIIIMCPYDGTKKGNCFMEGRDCIQCCKEWLQAEVEEGAE